MAHPSPTDAMEAEPTNITMTQNDYQAMVHRIQQLEEQVSSSVLPTPSTTTSSNEPATERPAPLASFVKPVRPAVYSGIKDYATLENWISSVDSYFTLTNACPPGSITI